MTMATYWDLSERDRAALTEQEVEGYIDAELMTRGVLRVRPLELVEEPTAPEPECEMFSVGSAYGTDRLVFFKEQDAEAAAVLCRQVGSRYTDGEFTYFVDVDAKPEVRRERLLSKAQAEANVKLIEKARTAKAENARRRRESEEARRKEHEALDGLWKDWHACRRKAVEMERVLETFLDYNRIAGDETVAMTFLAKVFALDVLREAGAWHRMNFAIDRDVAAPPEPDRMTGADRGEESAPW